MKYPEIFRSTSGGVLAALLLGLVSAAPAAAGGDWLPISPEELAMEDSAENPGAAAIILYRESFTDYGRQYTKVHSDVRPHMTVYYRIKIFTSEGRKHADVEIPYIDQFIRVTDIQGRTVQPDGTEVEFSGEVYKKVVWSKFRGARFMTANFALPDARAGSIIEYKYTLRWHRWFLPWTWWNVQQELFTQRARFTLWPADNPLMFDSSPVLRASGVLRQGKIERQSDGSLLLEVENVPAAKQEEHMPPASSLEGQVLFYYTFSGADSVDKFWGEEAEAWHKDIRSFTKKRKGVEAEARELIAAGEPPEEKLRKLYRRAQGIRNLSFEPPRTEKEIELEGLEENKSVDDVLKRGYGTADDINRLFLALAEAAGFKATAIRLATRDEHFFRKELLIPWQLNGELVVVEAGTSVYYADAGTPFCPFGLLSWEKTGAGGLQLAKDGYHYVTTHGLASREALTERQARLELDEQGTLRGKVRVVFRGQEALRRRLEMREKDEEARREKLEEEFAGWFSSRAKVTIEEMEGWEDGEEPLAAELTLEAEEFAVATGRRLLVPLGVLQAGEKHAFPHAERSQAVYFHYPWQEKDDVVLRLPPGYGVEAAPAVEPTATELGHYELSVAQEENSLQVVRVMAVNAILVGRADYPALRNFFSAVRAGDEQHAVLARDDAGAND